MDEDDGTGGDGGDGCFLSYVWLFVCLFRSGWRERRQRKGERERFVSLFFYTDSSLKEEEKGKNSKKVKELLPLSPSAIPLASACAENDRYAT